MADSKTAQTIEELPVGTRIHYTGDLANQPWGGTVTEVDAARGVVVVTNNDPDHDWQQEALFPTHVGVEYRPYDGLRFHTGKAKADWKADQYANSEASMMHYRATGEIR